MSEKEARKVVSAITYNSEKDSFLLVKRSSDRKRFPNEWEFPSGFVEDEDEKQAALRELKEETGLIGEVVRAGKPFQVETEKHRFRLHPALVLVESDDVELTEEHSEYQWIEKQDIDSFNTVPQLKQNLEAVDLV